MHPIVFRIRRPQRAGECKMSGIQMKIARCNVGEKAVRIADGLLNVGLKPLWRITVITAIHQPIQAPLEPAHLAIRIPLSQFALPTVYPPRIKTCHVWEGEFSVANRKEGTKRPRSGRIKPGGAAD